MKKINIIGFLDEDTRKEIIATPTGIILPFNPITFSKDQTFHPKILIRISSNEVFPKKSVVVENNNFGEIKKFEMLDTIQLFAKINFLFSESYHTYDSLELFIVKYFFKGNPLNRIQNLIKKKGKFFSRQQLLFLMKEFILNANIEKGKKLENNFDKVGNLLLKTNDVLELDLEISKLSSSVQVDNKLKAGLIRNIEFNSDQKFGQLLVRYRLLFFKYSRKIKKNTYPLLRTYFKMTKINVRLFMALVMSIYANYEHHKREEFFKNSDSFFISENYFKNFNEKAAKKITNMLSILSKTPKEFKELINNDDFDSKNKTFGFLTFRRNPFLKVNDNVFYPLDFWFLREKMTSGVYWEVFDGINDGEKQKLGNYWGKVFELYTRDILKRIFNYSSPSIAKRLFFEDKRRKQNIDAIIHYPDTLIFIEITFRSLKYKTLLSGDYDKIQEELKDLFFGGINYRKGKIQQLDKEIKRFKNGDFRIKGINPSSINNYYPLLIFNTAPTQFSKLWEDYNKMILNKGLLTDHIDKLQFMEIEELEKIEPIANKGIGFKDIIEEKLNSPIFKYTSFKDFLFYKYENGERVQNDFIKKEFNDFWEETKRLLFKTS